MPVLLVIEKTAVLFSGKLLNLTPVIPENDCPEMDMLSPVSPLMGLNPIILATGTNSLLETPDKPKSLETTRIFPHEEFWGTIASIKVLFNLVKVEFAL